MYKSDDSNNPEAAPTSGDTRLKNSSRIPSTFTSVQNTLYGPVTLARPWNSWVLVAITALILGCGFSYAIGGTYTKRTKVGGLILPEDGVVRVFSATPGVVQEFFVREGQQVSRGDTLMIVAEDKQTTGSAGTKRLAVSQSELLQKRRDSLVKTIAAIRMAGQVNERNLRQRVKYIEEQLFQNEEEFALLNQREISSQELAKRFRRLAELKAASSLELHERDEQVNAMRALIVASKRQRIDLQISLGTVTGELEQNRARNETQLSDFERELASIDEQIAEVLTRQGLAITAPINGMVGAINIQPGQSTGSSPLLMLIPHNSPVIAHLYAPSRAIGFVEPGQRIRMRFHAFPYQKFGQHEGVVKDISRSPLSPSELSEKLRAVNTDRTLISTDPEGLYRVRVEIPIQHLDVNGKKISFRPGMTFDADILQEKRQIIDWLLEPMRGMVLRIT